MKLLLIAILATVSMCAFSKDVIKIEIGSSNKSYSKKELQRRVWQLERAVWQLQQRVFHLEASSAPTSNPVADWICTVRARGEDHTGLGGSKAVAKHKALQACKDANDGSGFFCKTPKCEQ